MLDLTMDDGRDLRTVLKDMKEGRGKENVADKIHFLDCVVGVEIGTVKEYIHKGTKQLHCIGFLFDKDRFSVEGVKGLFYEVCENDWTEGKWADDWKGTINYDIADFADVEIARVDKGISVLFIY